jgi:hypothetical protein
MELLTLPTNISLGRKGLAGADALAYYKHLSIMAVKGFITLGPGQGLGTTHMSLLKLDLVT